MTTSTAATTTASNVTSVYQAAHALGAAAFARGAKRVPALDTELRALMASEPYQIGDDRCLARLDGWLRGWDEANLAAPLE
jgi:hypothetical protein